MRTVLTIALLAVLAGAAGAADRTGRRAAPARTAATAAAAQAMLDDIARRGARTVLEEIYGREPRWRPVIDGVASGQRDWLEVAARFKAVSLRNLSVSQELTVAVSRALERAPAQALRILGGGAFDADDVCSLVTLEDSLGPDYEAALRTVERRERAVSAVGDPALAPRRDDCLDFLKELKGEVVRNREGWFPAR
jgi:hypothetical protein